MSQNLVCYRCGNSLESLTPPLSRRDHCPGCSADLHVCKMCVFFDASVTRQCREDGAGDVTEKERPNFCDWFKPSANAFNSDRKTAADSASVALDALFSDTDGS